MNDVMWEKILSNCVEVLTYRDVDELFPAQGIYFLTIRPDSRELLTRGCKVELSIRQIQSREHLRPSSESRQSNHTRLSLETVQV